MSCGVGWQLQSQFDPLAWELLCAMGAALKKKKKEGGEKKDKKKKKKCP